jgi:CBS domain-containing protein
MLARSRGGAMKTETAPEFVSTTTTTVEEAMHPGVLTCAADLPLRAAARMMARYRVHALVVDRADEAGEPRAWRVLSDADVVAAAAGDLDGKTAGDAARTPVVAVARNASLREAAELMTRREVTHVVVVPTGRGRPVGVLSALDVARAVALEPGRDG